MPEEYNRIETDKIASWLFCPTQTAVQNLHNEGINHNVFHVGDVMYDAAQLFTPDETIQQEILTRYGLSSKQFILATIHRAATADNVPALSNIFKALAEIHTPVLLPLHPHTAKTVEANSSLQQLLQNAGNIHVIEPVGYIEMLALERQAKIIVTDSGGMQKEAYFQSTPCITLRDETEWIETIEAGWNKLAGTDTERILHALNDSFAQRPIGDYGDGQSAQKIMRILCPNTY